MSRIGEREQASQHSARLEPWLGSPSLRTPLPRVSGGGWREPGGHRVSFLPHLSSKVLLLSRSVSESLSLSPSSLLPLLSVSPSFIPSLCSASVYLFLLFFLLSSFPLLFLSVSFSPRLSFLSPSCPFWPSLSLLRPSLLYLPLSNLSQWDLLSSCLLCLHPLSTLPSSLLLSVSFSIHPPGSGSLSCFLHVFFHLQPTPHLQSYPVGVRADSPHPCIAPGLGGASGLGPRKESHPPPSWWLCSSLTTSPQLKGPSCGPRVWTKKVADGPELSPVGQQHPPHTPPSGPCGFAGNIPGTTSRNLRRSWGRSESPQAPPSIPFPKGLTRGGYCGHSLRWRQAASRLPLDLACEGGESREPKDRTTESCPRTHIFASGSSSDHDWSQFNWKLTRQGPLGHSSRLSIIVKTGDHPWRKEEQSPWNMSDPGPGFVSCGFSFTPKKPRRWVQWPAPNRWDCCVSERLSDSTKATQLEASGPCPAPILPLNSSVPWQQAVYGTDTARGRGNVTAGMKTQ